MTRQAYDACSPSGVPRDGSLVFGYADGLCAPAWTFTQADAWISSTGSDAGTILDVEPRNPTPTQAVDWVLGRRRAGFDPTVYCMDDGEGSDSVWRGWRHADVVAAFSARSVPEPHYWVAHPSGSSALPDYAVAVQYVYLPGYDISLCRDYWPGVDHFPPEDIMTPDQDARLTAIFEQLTQNATAGSIPTRGQQLEMLFGLFTNGGNPASLNTSFIDTLATAIVAKLPPSAGGSLTADAVAAAVTARLKGELS